MALLVDSDFADGFDLGGGDGIHGGGVGPFFDDFGEIVVFYGAQPLHKVVEIILGLFQIDDFLFIKFEFATLWCIAGLELPIFHHYFQTSYKFELILFIRRRKFRYNRKFKFQPLLPYPSSPPSPFTYSTHTISLPLNPLLPSYSLKYRQRGFTRKITPFPLLYIKLRVYK